MKHNTQSIGEGIFTHFPPSTIRSQSRNVSCRPPAKAMQAGTLFSPALRRIRTLQQIFFLHHNKNSIYMLLRKGALAYKDQVQSGVAALGIGIALLVTAYLFLIQLAEYGWQ